MATEKENISVLVYPLPNENEILIEILNNIKTNDSDINILTEITKNKIITLKELANTSTEFEDLTQKIE